jgi:ketosteroid isomerase-like protein
MPSRERELLDEFNDALNRHDVADMMSRMTEDCLFENTFPPPDGTRYEGQAAVRQFWEEFFRSSPQAHVEVEEIVVCGEHAVQRWRYRWVDAQGDAGYIRGIDLFRFQDGKIAEKRSYVKG